MKSIPFSRIRSFVLMVSFVLLAGGIGYRLGEKRAFPAISSGTASTQRLINQNASTGSGTVDFSMFWDVWQKMFRYYVDSSTLDMQKMTWGAITGMVSAAGDPYTSFLPPKENTDFKQDIGGEFEGIGAQLDAKDSRIVVTAPLKGSPAEAVGIRAGDYIMKVDGVSTAGWTVADAVGKIRGPKASSVVLTILHDGNKEPVDITVVRNTIMVPSVESWIKSVSEVMEIQTATEAAAFKTKPNRVAYIKLSRFGDHTNVDWDKAVSSVIAEQAKNPLAGLVFDLRNNPGGYLDGAVFIASEFVKSGIIVSQKNSDGSTQDLKVNRQGKLFDIPLVVLVNRGSASAAEIVAGALKDFKRAKIVGETSFGKGSVQTPFDLSQGASVHITTGKWLLPSGASISKIGISPDYPVSYDYKDVTGDSQLAKAIELLLQ